jgi:hypothetical protein
VKMSSIKNRMPNIIAKIYYNQSALHLTTVHSASH